MPESSKKLESTAPHADADPTNTRVIRNAGIVGLWTIVSRVLGLYRFRLMAHLFGATGVADAFNFAFIFPNLTRRLFGEGLLTSAFVPVFSGMLARGHKDEANKTASVLLCRLFYWLSAGCIAVIAGSTEAPLLEVAHAGFSNMRGMGLPRPGESIATVSRPFDASRDGFVLGEGAASLFLELSLIHI